MAGVSVTGCSLRHPASSQLVGDRRSRRRTRAQRGHLELPFDTAPYTWSPRQNLKGGRALFTQPPMPIKCAGAPQKAMYLSGDHWYRQGRINDIDIEFHTADPCCSA